MLIFYNRNFIILQVKKWNFFCLILLKICFPFLLQGFSPRKFLLQNFLSFLHFYKVSFHRFFYLQNSRFFFYFKLSKTELLLLLKNLDRKSTRLNSSHANISYAVFCLKKK